ncbi:CoA pyrophosphatase [Aquirufa ecclesiirivi]|uniref:NUDIX hydrolase n=2 Tax=Aquirufa ecclesiirivi TaxID=2715124 RepID=UPI0022A89041|nr:CoA pyrophosphatase [Aquirufa ecclesiirivi]MCZ2472093.1 CoA pyrophosphatase [Aquirufa ecclesiirivi]
MKEMFEPIFNLHQSFMQMESVKDNARHAAVVAIIHKNVDQHTIVLIKRNEYDGAHSGQMAFPGGKQELSDQDLKVTAIREVKEEIGIDVPYEALQALEPVWVMVSNYWVQPYFVVLEEKQNYVLDKREINRIFEIPVSHFQDSSQLKAHQLKIQNETYWAPQFEFEGEVIWGATALFLYQLFHLKIGELTL